MESIWEKDLEKEEKNKQSKFLRPDTELKRKEKQIIIKDIVVLGGGIAGYLCAYSLAESGHKVTLIEAEKLFSGVTKNTTAHINALQGKYKDIPGNKKRRDYFESQLLGVDGIEELVNKHKIMCDFKRVDSYVFGGTSGRDRLKKEFKILEKIGADVTYEENTNFLFGTFDAIKLKNQAVFNPIKFLQGLPRKFEVLENTRIKKVSLIKKELETNSHIFKADKIIFASSFPVVNIRGLYAFKMYKSISYAVHIKTNKRLNAIFNSIEDDGLTCRDSEEGIITGGLDHRSGRIKSCGKLKALKKKAGQLDGKVSNEWAANDCITFDYIPYAGNFKWIGSKDIYIVSGFGKWGMTNALVCSRIIRDIISSGKNKYEKLFSPTRFLSIRAIPKFLFNAVYNILNISKTFFTFPLKTYKSLKRGSGGIVWHNSTKRAVYKDEAGKLHVIEPMCPHMLCQLKFNKDLKTWDCPCHGSRLDIEGNIISNPAVKNAECII